MEADATLNFVVMFWPIYMYGLKMCIQLLRAGGHLYINQQILLVAITKQQPCSIALLMKFII